MNNNLISLLHQLNASKISLNVTKSEVVIFRIKGKVFDTGSIVKMCSQKLYPSYYKNYLGVYIDEYLNWASHVDQLYMKLFKAKAMLSKTGILLMKPLSYLYILLSSIPIYLQCFIHSVFLEGLSFMNVDHSPICVSSLTLAAESSRGCCKSLFGYFSNPKFSNSFSIKTQNGRSCEHILMLN